MSNSAHVESTVVGCSVKGPDHEENGQPCQDAWMCSQVTGGRFVITVADGLGSKNLSHEGSKLATREAANTLTQYLSDVETIKRGTSKEAVRDAIVNARDAIAEKASELDQPMSELGTTLLVIVAGPSGLAGAAVGDGGIVYHSDGMHDLLIPREMAIIDIEATNITIPLVSDAWEDSYRFGYRDQFDGVAVFSDGIEEFAWDGLETVQTEVFNQLFNYLQSAQNTQGAQQELRELLNSDRYRKFSGDDKTLAVGMMSSKPDTKSHQTDQRAVLNTMGSGKPPTIDFEGEDVKLNSDEHISLGEVLATRPDGKIYEIREEESEANAVKILSPQKRFTENVETKIRSMAAVPPKTSTSGAPTLEWPTGVVHTIAEKQFLGYRLSYIDFEETSNILSWAKANRGAQDTNPSSSSDVIQVILDMVGFDGAKTEDGQYSPEMELASTVAHLHQKGYAIGNLDHSRVLMRGNCPFLTRCYEFYTDDEDETHTINNTTPRYASPVESNSELEQIKHEDRFGLAVHLFQLMMGGYHPFETQESKATEQGFQEIIEETPFPYRDPQPGLLEPPRGAPSYTSLPAELRTQFERCFIQGKTHPQLRPDASTWVGSLESADISSITTVNTNSGSINNSRQPDSDQSGVG